MRIPLLSRIFFCIRIGFLLGASIVGLIFYSCKNEVKQIAKNTPLAIWDVNSIPASDPSIKKLICAIKDNTNNVSILYSKDAENSAIQTLQNHPYFLWLTLLTALIATLLNLAERIAGDSESAKDTKTSNRVSCWLSIASISLGVLHFIKSGCDVDWIVVALLITCFIPWMSEVFESIGLKDGLLKYRPREGNVAIPIQPTKEQEKSPFYKISSEARRVLATLWQQQKANFPNTLNNLWTFTVPLGSPNYPDFLRGISELMNIHYISISPSNGHVMISSAGVDFCRDNDAEISSYKDVYTLFISA